MHVGRCHSAAKRNDYSVDFPLLWNFESSSVRIISSFSRLGIILILDFEIVHYRVLGRRIDSLMMKLDWRKKLARRDIQAEFLF